MRRPHAVSFTHPSELGRSVDDGETASMASAKPSSAAVCCMCGDQGLLAELFPCAVCSARSQHKYCTERYPKVESYGTCNWCLRAGQGSAAGATASSSPERSAVEAVGNSDPGGSNGRSVAAAKVVAARGDFTAELNKPIKKQQQQRRLLLRRSASASVLGSGSRGRVSADHGEPPSPGVSRSRPRVQRYKLLEEVISS